MVVKKWIVWVLWLSKQKKCIIISGLYVMTNNILEILSDMLLV